VFDFVPRTPGISRNSGFFGPISGKIATKIAHKWIFLAKLGSEISKHIVSPSGKAKSAWPTPARPVRFQQHQSDQLFDVRCSNFIAFLC